MKAIIAGLIAATMIVTPLAAEAKGCLKGAAVGGVGGHFAGGHSLIGAAGGCLVGRHLANRSARRQAAAQNNGYNGTTAPTHYSGAAPTRYQNTQ